MIKRYYKLFILVLLFVFGSFFFISSVDAYDRKAAVDYADRYCNDGPSQGYNSYFKFYEKYNILWDLDCTNFLSQCFIAGNMRFDNAYESLVDDWGCIIRASEIGDELLKRHGVITTSDFYYSELPTELEKANPVIMIHQNNNVPHHSMIIVGVDNNLLTYDAHSNDKYHEPFGNIGSDLDGEYLRFYRLSNAPIIKYMKLSQLQGGEEVIINEYKYDYDYDPNVTSGEYYQHTYNTLEPTPLELTACYDIVSPGQINLKIIFDTAMSTSNFSVSCYRDGYYENYEFTTSSWSTTHQSNDTWQGYANIPSSAVGFYRIKVDAYASDVSQIDSDGNLATYSSGPDVQHRFICSTHRWDFTSSNEEWTGRKAQYIGISMNDYAVFDALTSDDSTGAGVVSPDLNNIHPEYYNGLEVRFSIKDRAINSSQVKAYFEVNQVWYGPYSMNLYEGNNNTVNSLCTYGVDFYTAKSQGLPDDWINRVRIDFFNGGSNSDQDDYIQVNWIKFSGRGGTGGGLEEEHTYVIPENAIPLDPHSGERAYLFGTAAVCSQVNPNVPQDYFSLNGQNGDSKTIYYLTSIVKVFTKTTFRYKFITPNGEQIESSGDGTKSDPEDDGNSEYESWPEVTFYGPLTINANCQDIDKYNGTWRAELWVDAHTGEGFQRVVADTFTVEYSNCQDTTSPSVNIASPTSNDTYSTNSSSIVLSGSASDNVGVTQVTWQNDKGESGTARGTTSWITGDINLQSGTNVITITAQDSAGNTGWDILSVYYSPPIQTYSLNVYKTSSGSGTITSNPSGINCGSNCSEVYNDGTSITLYAQANSGSVFTNWSGDCSGSSLSCSVSMNSNKSATAKFVAEIIFPFNGQSVEKGVTEFDPTHIIDLRNAVDSLRSNLFGWAGYDWTDSPSPQSGGPILVEYIRELRKAVEQIYQQLERSISWQTDPNIYSYQENPENATGIKAEHINELRRAIEDIWNN